MPREIVAFVGHCATMRAAHAGAAGVGRPIRAYISADQPTRGADHARIGRGQRRVIRQPIRLELGAVIAPRRRAVDQKIAAAMVTEVTQRHGRKRLAVRAVVSFVRNLGLLARSVRLPSIV